MATVSRELPEQPHLDIPKREARELLDAVRAASPEAWERVRARHPRFSVPATSSDGAPASTAPRLVPPGDVASSFKLADAQLVIAREYGLASWPVLKRRIEASAVVRELLRAIHADERETTVRLLRANPDLLHVPLWSGNWGPPLSHAANLGRLEIIQAISSLGARDHQHAFDRAILQGKLECARWLHTQGVQLVPGLILGPCETLNADGFRFLVELGAPLTDETGSPLVPLAHTLGTYGRRPAGKHAILAILESMGRALPETPVMALHRGDLTRLREHLRRDPSLLHRRFSLREIYPAECGCGADGGSGMHWTPIDGGTLLHLAIDFREREVFDWLLAEGADVNARTAIDAAGWGGHTPLFAALVNGTDRDPAMTRALLDRGATPDARASLRKFLDWCEEPRWHEARDATPAEWAKTFPEKGWVNTEALKLLER